VSVNKTIDEGSYHSVQVDHLIFLPKRRQIKVIQLFAENKLAFDEAF
jgi:hypothetical protein